MRVSMIVGLVLGVALSAWSQTLIVSPSATASLNGMQVLAQEIVSYPLGGGTSEIAVSRGCLGVLMGDNDGDGRFDDLPGVVDAIAVAQGAANDALGFYLSFETTTTFADGTSVLDGDIVTLGPSGHASIVWTEAMFAAATQTSTIDIDAFHIDTDGSLLFSFDADETTQSTSLVAQNGGSNVLDETIVFRLAPGAVDATIFLSRPAVLAAVNNAIGTSLSTVVDLIGLSEDPNNSGAFLFTLGSANGVLEGRVFSTANGGMLVLDNGVNLDAMSMGFATNVNLNGLAIRSAAPGLILEAPVSIMTGVGASSVFAVRHATPSGIVKLLASNATPTALPTVAQPLLGPSTYSFLDFTDPFFYDTWSLSFYQRQTEIDGTATFVFPTANVPPGLNVVFQAFDLTGLRLSLPVAVGT